MPDRTIALVDLPALYRDLAAEIDAAIKDICERSAFIGGEPVRAFEEAFADHTGAAMVIGVANGTDALQLALTAARLPAGSVVLLPANTFIATAEAVVAAGLTCRFVDVAPDTGLVEVEGLEAAVDDRVSAIIPVHMYGRLADMHAIGAFAARHGLFVVEDAAQAHGARRAGRHAGTFGQAGTFSFYPGKNLGAFGDAGAVVTDDPGLADAIRLLRDHGRRGRDNHAVVGLNSRLDALQAQILSVKLPHLDRWQAQRRRVAAVYRERLDAALLDWTGPGKHAAETESHHLFPVLLDDRDAVADELRRHGVMTAVHYRQTVPGTPAFGGVTGRYPNAERRAAHQLSLPMHPYLRDEDAAYVATLVCDLAATRA
jgi:dTDP-4-amino-4,6-dideoxygalactose transaminase